MILDRGWCGKASHGLGEVRAGSSFQVVFQSKTVRRTLSLHVCNIHLMPSEGDLAVPLSSRNDYPFAYRVKISTNSALAILLPLWYAPSDDDYDNYCALYNRRTKTAFGWLVDMLITSGYCIIPVIWLLSPLITSTSFDCWSSGTRETAERGVKNLPTNYLQEESVAWYGYR